MASSRAVRPCAAVYIRRVCSSSTLLVKRLVNCARSLKLTRKNSSCGFAVLKNCTAASRALSTLLAILPLKSKTTPIEMGTSSLEKCTTSCSALSSKTRKFSCSRPVTKRLKGSVTVTLTSTRSTSTLMVPFRLAWLVLSLPGLALGALVSPWRGPWPGAGVGLFGSGPWAVTGSANRAQVRSKGITARSLLLIAFPAPPTGRSAGRRRCQKYSFLRFYHGCQSLTAPELKCGNLPALSLHQAHCKRREVAALQSRAEGMW